MTGLRGMIRNELARRDESGAKWPAFSFVVDDKHPAALTDVAAAVKAVMAGADDRAAGQGDRVRITSAVYEAVVDALRAHSSRRDIVVRTIEESGLRFAPRPEIAAGAGPSSAEQGDFSHETAAEKPEEQSVRWDSNGHRIPRKRSGLPPQARPELPLGTHWSR